MEAALAGAAIGIIPGGKLVKLLGKTGLFKSIGRLGSSAFKTASHYASKAGARLRDAGGWVARKAQKLAGKGGCGCFTAATLVWTANGAVPIAEIEEGQQVLAAPDEGQAQDYASNEVSTKIIIGEASLVQLVVLHEDGAVETVNTTDEHPFHVAETAQWTRADQLIIGDELSTISGTATLTGVVYTTERVPVYNLSISGSPTYYVGERGVWVHNCKLAPLTRGNFRKNLDRVFPKPGPGYHAHHVIPYEWAHLFPEKNLNDPIVNGAWVNETVHITGITADWRRWKTANPNPSARDVLDQVSRINREYAGAIITP